MPLGDMMPDAPLSRCSLAGRRGRHLSTTEYIHFSVHMMRPNYGKSERGYKLQKVVKYWAEESKLILLESKKFRAILKTVGNSLVLPSGFVDPPTLLSVSVSRTVINRPEAGLS